MAGEYNKSHDYETKPEEVGATETQDRGLFDFMGNKKEEEKHEETIATEFEKVKVSEPEPAYYDSKPEHEEKKHETLSEKLHGYNHEEPKVEEEKKHESLAEKLHRSGSSSSSSSSDEEGDDEEKKKKKRKEKKGLKEKLKEKIAGGDNEEEKKHDTEIPVEKYDHHEEAKVEPAYGEEKKGFLEKIKEKLPGSKKPEDGVSPSPAPEHVEASYSEGEVKEKKGLLEKIKEKMPGYHSKTEEEKEKEKPAGSY